MAKPTTWLIARREDSNYNIPRYVEPGVPSYFAEVEKNGARTQVTRYMNDVRDLYTFSVDHAILAYPLAVLVEAGKYIQGRGGIDIDDDEMAFLTQKCGDSSGAITAVTNFIDALR
jgi:hypothetical protein